MTGANNNLLLTIFLATLPILIAILGGVGAVIWNLIEVKGIRVELVEIRKSLQSLAERVATLEERDRWTHPVVRP